MLYRVGGSTLGLGNAFHLKERLRAAEVPFTEAFGVPGALLRRSFPAASTAGFAQLLE